MRIRASWGRVDKPRGGVAIVFAALLPAFVGLIALSVDIAVIATARGQMETAADAAALAGARQLFTDNHLVSGASMSAEISAAQSSATAVAAANKVLNAAPVIVANPSNSSNGDVVVGYLNPTSYSAAFTNSGSQSSYNAVQVTVSRNATHGGVIPALFSRLAGSSGTGISDTSVAVAQNYAVGGFSSSSTGMNANILPIALDQTTYNAMIAGNPNKLTTTGLPTDQYAYNPSTGKVTSGQDGIYESSLYPVSNGSPGNWGTVKIGVSNNSTSTLGAQILSGITPAQLAIWAATFPKGTIQFDQQLDEPPVAHARRQPGHQRGDQVVDRRDHRPDAAHPDLQLGLGQREQHHLHDRQVRRGPRDGGQLPGQPEVRHRPAGAGQRPDGDPVDGRVELVVGGPGHAPARPLIPEESARRAGRRETMRRIAGLVLAVASVAAPATAQMAQAPDRVEEDWRLVVASPDVDGVAPQITTSMCPVADRTQSPFVAFDLNYREYPTFTAGGYQAQVWSNDQLLQNSSGGKTDQFATANETITWTQRMSLANGQVQLRRSSRATRRPGGTSGRPSA